jgi:hypothetical protein
MTESKPKPIHEVRLGRVRAAVWQNTTDKGTRHSVTFSKLYKDPEGRWKDTASFGKEDLLLLAEVAKMVAQDLWERSEWGKNSEEEAEG